jgi:hypothetical protein
VYLQIVRFTTKGIKEALGHLLPKPSPGHRKPNSHQSS